MDEQRLRPLSEFIIAGPLSYDQFLSLALPIVEAVTSLHEQSLAHGHLDSASIFMDNNNRVTLSESQSGTIALDKDLEALGKIFYLMLTGKSFEDNPDRSALKRIYPVEARLTVEKLLGLHSTGQFVSVGELYASLVLMKDVYESSNRAMPVDPRTGSARIYLALSLLALLLVLLWIILSFTSR